MPSYLALDLGASSGRAVLGTLGADGRMATAELHRFETPLREQNGHLVWDVDALDADAREGLRRALDAAPDLRSVSVDAWGVDYVPLGADGARLRPPFAYRDARTAGVMDAVHARLPRPRHYRRTGIQFLPFNTLYQAAADPPAERARTATRLFIADYLAHRLGGAAVAEVTMASTSAALDVHTRTWAYDVIEAAGLEPTGWPALVPPGTVTGHVGGHPGVAVVATCAHDTAAAGAAVPAEAGTRWAYLSLGTWALLGVERAAPVLTDAACAASFTNEAGLDGTVRFLKNLTGLWVLEECARAWRASGAFTGGWPDLLAAADASAYDARLDLDDPAFAPPGAMPARLAAALTARGAPAPATPGDLARCVLRSLADAVADRLATLDVLTGTPTEILHVVGGGSRNALLCGWIADACGVPVVAGPAEATALGNLLVQARTLGDLPPGRSLRDVARASSPLVRYEPGEREA